LEHGIPREPAKPRPQDQSAELTEEILNYHRDEDYKIVRLRDDLISAVRYAFMSRSGEPLEGCEQYGRAPCVGTIDMYEPRPRRDRSREPQIARNGFRSVHWSIASSFASLSA
jgi:hypothetical protein